MKIRRRSWRRAIAVGVLGGGLLLAAALGSATLGAGAAAAADQNPSYYLALGGSDSVGLQPTAAIPHGQPTDDGYADDLLDSLRSQGQDLRLVQLGCPGETTGTMLDGGDTCGYAEGSQLAAAVSFLDQHASTVLVTLDLGFNDVVHCMGHLGHHAVDDACVAGALANIRAQLPQIVSALQRAGGPSLRIVGVGHYDPYLAAYRDGPAGETFATQSVEVITRLNAALRAAYEAAGIPMADVAAAFAMTDTTPTALAGTVVPRNVERTCDLTWECVPGPLGPNKHPNDEGYRAISDAISAVLSKG